MNRLFVASLALLLAGCATPDTIIKEVPIEVKVPVTVPCMGERPEEPQALRDFISRDAWDALTTDQRENLTAAQALAHKNFGDRSTVAAAGCQ